MPDFVLEAFGVEFVRQVVVLGDGTVHLCRWPEQQASHGVVVAQLLKLEKAGRGRIARTSHARCSYRRGGPPLVLLGLGAKQASAHVTGTV